MKEVINNFIEFLFTDVKDKNETKELAVLLRLTCLIFSVYYFIVAISIAFIQHYYLSLALVFAIGLLVGAFILTYENKTFLGLVLLNLVIIVFSTLLAINVGFEMDFHIAIFLNILIIYFNKSEHMHLKRFYTVFICTYLMVLTQFCDYYINVDVPWGFSRIFIRSLNMVLMACCIGCIAYSFCTKFNQAEDKLRSINENLERIANLDPLTQLSNRHHMNEYLKNVIFEHNRSGKTFTIAIGDIDFFKKVNDTYGHEAGDYVLKSVAAEFQNHMKGIGHVARWGGEEFLFAFEGMDAQTAYTSLDALRQKLERKQLRFKEFDFNITMTYGLEEFNDRMGIEATINRADGKLYKGKQSGRNRVVF